MKSKQRFYCDHAATTPIDEIVLSEIARISRGRFANPSSTHQSGQAAKSELEKSRRKMAKFCNAPNANVIFTSGGTESDNLAILGLARGNRENGNHIIISNIEHPAVAESCKYLENDGFEISVLPVNKNGILPPESVKNAIRKNTILISVMAVNNELGTIQPIEEIAKIANGNGILFHTDAVQAFGKIPIDFEKIGFDALSISSHKIYGPKGVGALVLKKNVKIQPLVFGGKQENLIRTGTENLPGIVGFAKAAELMFAHFEFENARLKKIENKFVAKLSEIGAQRTVPTECAYPGIINLLFPGISAEILLQKLDLAGVEASGGSACSSGAIKVSPVVQALGIPDEIAQSAVRFSFGRATKSEDISEIAEIVTEQAIIL